MSILPDSKNEERQTSSKSSISEESEKKDHTIDENLKQIRKNL